MLVSVIIPAFNAEALLVKPSPLPFRKLIKPLKLLS